MKSFGKEYTKEHIKERIERKRERSAKAGINLKGLNVDKRKQENLNQYLGRTMPLSGISIILFFSAQFFSVTTSPANPVTIKIACSTHFLTASASCTSALKVCKSPHKRRFFLDMSAISVFHAFCFFGLVCI